LSSRGANLDAPWVIGAAAARNPDFLRRLGAGARRAQELSQGALHAQDRSEVVWRGFIQQTNCGNTFAVTLTAIHKRKTKQDKAL
jgi:hypothetical protein